MKRLVIVAAILALLAVFAAPAAVAVPGNGAGWFTAEAVCDGDPVTISAHGGIWSAVYVEGDGHFILTYQKIEVDGELFAEVSHPGHTNPGPIVSCWLEDDEFFPGQTAVITFNGFFKP